MIGGFPSQRKRATIRLVANRQKHRLGLLSPAWLFMPSVPLAGPSFVPTCCRPFHDVISAVPQRNALPPDLLPVQTRKRMRRGYLHHHLPGAGGLHLPAPAERPRTAHRKRAAALRSGGAQRAEWG